MPNHISLKQRILYEMHAAPYSGHLGAGNTERNIAQHYWWPNMQTDVIQYVKTCPICQRNRKPTHKPFGRDAELAGAQGHLDKHQHGLHVTGLANHNER